MLLLLLFLKILNNKLTSNLRHTCHTTPIRTKITKSIEWTSRPREQDLEWATEIYKRGLIKTEFTIDKDLYFYYFDHQMSINRGKWGSLNKEEKKLKITQTLNTIKDFEWDLQPIDKINIKWI